MESNNDLICYRGPRLIKIEGSEIKWRSSYQKKSIHIFKKSINTILKFIFFNRLMPKRFYLYKKKGRGMKFYKYKFVNQSDNWSIILSLKTCDIAKVF